jgi:DNA-binding FrmR family transcriptional regulator
MGKITKEVGRKEIAGDANKLGPHPVNRDALKRLNIIEGQVKGLQRMVEEEKYCIDVLTQISAVRSALNKVGQMVLKRHIESCVANSVKNGSIQNSEIIDELMEVFAKQEI